MTSLSQNVPCVLYINGLDDARASFIAEFRSEFHVLAVASPEEAMAELARRTVHVVISDQHQDGVTGCRTLQAIRASHPHVRRMLVTADLDLQAVVDALNQAGVCRYIQRPWEAAEVRRAVQEAFADIQAESERAVFMDRLVETNRQLEFALRQQLLS